MPTGIVFQATEDPTYSDRRKALSAAFFKSKLLGMTKIIKETTLKVIKDIQSSNLTEISLAQMTVKLQSEIILNVSVGMGHSQRKLEYERADGVLENIYLCDYLIRLIADTI